MNEYENLRENFRFPELRSSGSMKCLYQNILVFLFGFRDSWLHFALHTKTSRKFLIFGFSRSTGRCLYQKHLVLPELFYSLTPKLLNNFCSVFAPHTKTFTKILDFRSCRVKELGSLRSSDLHTEGADSSRHCLQCLPTKYFVPKMPTHKFWNFVTY